LVSDEGFIKKSFCITDLSGKILASGNFISEENEVDLKNCAAGIYFLRLFTDQQLIEVKKVLKH
jgi:hypothetical protein